MSDGGRQWNAKFLHPADRWNVAAVEAVFPRPADGQGDLFRRMVFNALVTNTDGDVAAIAAAFGNPGFEYAVELPPPQAGIRVRRTGRDS